MGFHDEKGIVVAAARKRKFLSSNDMNNLLAGTAIGTIFVDQKLRILRFTPSASRIINLILSDLGRPVGHIVSNLVGYDRIVADTQTVLASLVPKELDVQTKEGKWYTMRILPYRTLENAIAGAVISFVDITDLKIALDALQTENENMRRLAVVVRDSHDAITVSNLEGRMLAWNPAAVHMYGWTEAEALAMNIRDRIPEEDRNNWQAKMRRLSVGRFVRPYLARRIIKAWMTATALIKESGRVCAITTTERERKKRKDLHHEKV